MPVHLDPVTGLLAPGRHNATIEEVRVALVDPFPLSRTRVVIFERWLEYREAIAEIVPLGRQWLNGSFATSKVDPRDADVVTFLDHAEVDVLAAPKQIQLGGLFHGRLTKKSCMCDAGLVVEYPLGHASRRTTEEGERYWVELYERVRDAPANARKGFVEVIG